MKGTQQQSYLSNSSLPSRPFQRDPSLRGGYSMLYDNQIGIDMKYIDYDRNVNHVGTNEFITVKILVSGMKPNISRIKILLESESDPFFSSAIEYDQARFNFVRDEQKLTMGFQELPTVLIKCLNSVEEQKGKINAGILIHSDGKSHLTLTQTSEFKNIEIISLHLNHETDDAIEDKVVFKYKELKNKIGKAEERLAKVNQIIREKNPNLLLQITKTKGKFDSETK